MNTLETRRALLDMTHDLVRQYEGRLPAGSVIRCVARCREELMVMGVRDGLGVALEAMARHRLDDRCSRSLGDSLVEAI